MISLDVRLVLKSNSGYPEVYSSAVSNFLPDVGTAVQVHLFTGLSGDAPDINFH